MIDATGLNLQITVDAETLAKIDLVAIKLSLLSGVDWDTTTQFIKRQCFAHSIPSADLLRVSRDLSNSVCSVRGLRPGTN